MSAHDATGQHRPRQELERRNAELERRIAELEESEARFRTIIEKTADAIVIVDANGAVQFANPAAAKLFRRTAEELSGQPFGFPVVAGETAEIDVVSGDGSAIIAELRCAETMWDGKLAYLASLRDITDRRKSEERARKLVIERNARASAEAAERRSTFLAEASILLGSSLDTGASLSALARLICPFMADWSAIDIVENRKIRRIATCHSDASRERHLDELKRRYAPDPHHSDDPVARVIATGTPELFTEVTEEWLRGIARNDAHFAVLAALEPRSLLIVPINARGRTIGAMTLAFANSGRRYTPQDLDVAQEIARRAGFAVDNARLYQRAREANQAKSDFLAVMSHELRTPLNAILGYGDLMLLGVPERLPDALQRHVERITFSAKHLLRLIDEILTFTRVEAGREQVRHEPVSVREIVAQSTEVVEPLAAEKGIRLTAQTVDDPLVIESDAGKVRQILLNLLSNAVKFTDHGSVHVELRRDDGVVTIRVRDTGIGIPPEHVERIFDPFWQVEQKATRRAGGTGLGLTITRRLAHLLGGDVQVESTPQKGSTFTVRLPVRNVVSPGHLP
jgi:signal transduction histidine kinase